MSAFPPSLLRETAMFAMFTPASPNIVPTLPITPGRSSYDEERHARCELDVDVEAERAREEEPVLGADGRARDLDLLAVRRDRRRDEVRVVLRAAVALLRDLDPSLGRDHRRIHVVHRLVGAALERAVQRGDGQEPRVVVRERPVRGDDDAAQATVASAVARRPSLAASGMYGPSTSRSPCSTTGMLTAVVDEPALRARPRPARR